MCSCPSREVLIFAALPNLQAGADYDQETIASLGLMVQFILLCVVFCLGHVLRRNKILIVHEAGAALLLGELLLWTNAVTTLYLS
jgi:hypothetical protein